MKWLRKSGSHLAAVLGRYYETSKDYSIHQQLPRVCGLVSPSGRILEVFGHLQSSLLPSAPSLFLAIWSPLDHFIFRILCKARSYIPAMYLIPVVIDQNMIYVLKQSDVSDILPIPFQLLLYSPVQTHQEVPGSNRHCSVGLSGHMNQTELRKIGRWCLDVDANRSDGYLPVFIVALPFAQRPNMGESVEYAIEAPYH